MSVTGIGQSSNVYTPTRGGPAGGLAGASAKSAPEAEFLKWAKMSPGERMRANFLSSMGLTEEQVAAMSPDDRKKVEDKIRQMIEDKITHGDKKPLVDKTA